MNTHVQASPPPFDLQPTLHGSLVELRPLRPDDWDALYAEASDPLVWEQHPGYCLPWLSAPISAW